MLVIWFITCSAEILLNSKLEAWIGLITLVSTLILGFLKFRIIVLNSLS